MDINRIVAWIVALLLLINSPSSTTTEQPQQTQVQTQVQTQTEVVEPLKIVVEGDSISCGGLPDTQGWCPELSRLLTAAGISYQIIPLSVGGTRCDYWAEHTSDILSTYDPDIVILGCGQNDGAAPPNGLAASQTITAINTIAEQVYASGAKLLIGQTHYSSGTPASWEHRPWLSASIQVTNNALVAAWTGFVGLYGPTFSPSMYDDTRMPALAQFVQGDGVHPTAEGYLVLGHNRYKALANGFIPGLPAIPPDCLQIGHPPGTPVPKAIPCFGRPN